MDKKILLFVADNIQNERKGFRYLRKALAELQRDDFVCLLVGDNEKSLQEDYFLPLHFISEESELAEVYAAADICIVPSLEDNLPNTVLEAMASALPVIGFEVGGIPDMVLSGQNGFLAKLKDSHALAQNIERILEEDTTRACFAQKSRQMAEQHYAIQRQAKQCLSLYEDILNIKRDSSKLLKTS